MATEAPYCRETILDDVIRITLCWFDGGTFSRPQNVTSADITAQGAYTPVASFSTSDPYAALPLAQAPSISLTSARTEQGLVYTHELTMTVSGAIQAAEAAASRLTHSDFAIIYEKADGSSALSLPLPNTSLVTVEESAASSPTATVKAKMQSLSGLINLTFA